MNNVVEAVPLNFLLVEDDPEIRSFLERALGEAGYRVQAVASAEEGMDLVADGEFDLFIVDLTLPGMDGLEFIQACRARGVYSPVLILSARRSVDERVQGLEKGGDDYLTKPFALAELLARVQALLRRRAPAQQETTTLRVADLELDLLRRGLALLGALHRALFTFVAGRDGEHRGNVLDLRVLREVLARRDQRSTGTATASRVFNGQRGQQPQVGFFRIWNIWKTRTDGCCPLFRGISGKPGRGVAVP